MPPASLQDVLTGCWSNSVSFRSLHGSRQGSFYEYCCHRLAVFSSGVNIFQDIVAQVVLDSFGGLSNDIRI